MRTIVRSLVACPLLFISKYIAIEFPLGIGLPLLGYVLVLLGERATWRHKARAHNRLKLNWRLPILPVRLAQTVLLSLHVLSVW